MSQFEGTKCANPGCRHRDKPIPKRYKCVHCGSILHNAVLGCSAETPERDGKIECLPHVGCQKPKRAASDAKPSVESSEGTDEDGSFNYEDSDDEDDLKIVSTKKVPKTDYFPESESDVSDRSFISLLEPERSQLKPSTKRKTSSKQQPSKKKKKIGAKRGPKHGKRKIERPKSFWSNLCLKYENLKPKMAVGEFLKSSESGNDISNSKSNRQSLNRYLVQYRSAKLVASKNIRESKTLYPEIENMLLKYIELRQQRFAQEHIGISWLLMHQKLLQWKDAMPDQEKYSSFQASPGFINRCLHRHGITRITLHGEGSDMPEDERLRLAADFEGTLSDLIRQLDLQRFQVFNADQTSLFYCKIPNVIYGDKDAKKTMAGVKAMNLSLWLERPINRLVSSCFRRANHHLSSTSPSEKPGLTKQ
jgi:hypothetical protein